MSRAHSAAPLADAPDLEAAFAVVRAHGLRLSTARRLVLEALYEHDEALPADRLAGDLDIASVYRNLEALEQIGPGLYARASLGGREYLVCDACGAVVAVDPARLDGVRALIRREFGYEARFTHFPIAGLCPQCAAEGA
jgi:Fur family ferric uptake transcriptional regulator